MENKIRNYNEFNVDIHGKQYRTVAGRVVEFWDKVKEQNVIASIKTDITFMDKTVKAKAIIKFGEHETVGHATETIGERGVNEHSAVENCETSAVGRALSFMGIGIIEGIASAEEVEKGTLYENEEKTNLLQYIHQKNMNFINEGITHPQYKKICVQLDVLNKTIESFVNRFGKEIKDLSKKEASDIISQLEKEIKTSKIENKINKEDDINLEDIPF